MSILRFADVLAIQTVTSVV